MDNIRELSIGSIIMVRHENNLFSIAQIEELLQTKATVTILENNFDGFVTNFKPGTVHRVEYDNICGLAIRDMILRDVGFVEADKNGWQLMFYYGDMKLLYRHDKRRGCASFRFMSDFQKIFVRISCHTLHQLQNIMRFLTDGLEFKYNPITADNETKKYV